MTPITIFDLDNCLADDSWRIPRINWHREDQIGRYNDYHALAAFDKLGEIPWQKFHARRQESQIAFLTGRPIMFRASTIEWIRRNLRIEHFQIFMRPLGDDRRSVLLKRQQLDWVLNSDESGGVEILAAYDDRPEIVEMYRHCGVKAEVLAIHDVDAYTCPNGVNHV